MSEAQGPLICVYGAGSVGCLIGGLLSQAAKIILVGRAWIGDEIAAHGLTLTSWRREETRVPSGGVPFSVEASAVAEADLILLTVKSGATEAAGNELARFLKPSAVVISFQNGIGNAELLRRLLPRQPVLAGMVPFNVVHRSGGVFHRASEGELAVEEHQRLEPFMAPFAQAGLPLMRRRDMAQVQWGKLLLNLNNPINALSDLPLKDELADRDYRRCLALLQREALAILEAAHIRPARLTPLPASFLPALLELPNMIFTRLASRMIAINPLARSSTYEDLRAGRRTEIDYINGEIVRLAEKLGRQAPANARVVGLIRAAEAGDRKRFGGAELLRELRRSASIAPV